MVTDAEPTSGAANGTGVDPSAVVLGIETSCDETAAAVVVGGRHVRSSVVSSQIDLHARYGGVVPEIASRAHVELLTPVVAQALVEAGVADGGVDVVAATVGPGLIGSLLVGVSAAKALALAWDVPFVGVNHLEAHLYASTLEVRASNVEAQGLYRRFGLLPAGLRKNYYADLNEDAIVMWAHDVDTPAYASRLTRIEADLPGSTVEAGW